MLTSFSLFSCKFKTIEKAPSPPPPPQKKNYIASTFAICKEIKKNTGYTCTVCGYDEIYLFIIRRQAIIVKRHFRVDVKLHLITLFLVVFSCYWYDHLPKKPTLFVPLPTVSSINWKTVRSYLPHPCEWHVTKMHYRNWQTHGRFFLPQKTICSSNVIRKQKIVIVHWKSRPLLCSCHWLEPSSTKNRQNK